MWEHAGMSHHDMELHYRFRNNVNFTHKCKNQGVSTGFPRFLGDRCSLKYLLLQPLLFKKKKNYKL